MDVLTRIVVPGGASQQWLGKDLATPPYKLTADPTWTAIGVSRSGVAAHAHQVTSKPVLIPRA